MRLLLPSMMIFHAGNTKSQSVALQYDCTTQGKGMSERGAASAGRGAHREIHCVRHDARVIRGGIAEGRSIDVIIFGKGECPREGQAQGSRQGASRKRPHDPVFYSTVGKKTSCPCRCC